MLEVKNNLDFRLSNEITSLLNDLPEVVASYEKLLENDCFSSFSKVKTQLEKLDLFYCILSNKLNKEKKLIAPDDLSSYGLEIIDEFLYWEISNAKSTAPGYRLTAIRNYFEYLYNLKLIPFEITEELYYRQTQPTKSIKSSDSVKYYRKGNEHITVDKKYSLIRIKRGNPRLKEKSCYNVKNNLTNSYFKDDNGQPICLIGQEAAKEFVKNLYKK